MPLILRMLLNIFKQIGESGIKDAISLIKFIWNGTRLENGSFGLPEKMNTAVEREVDN